MIKLAKKKLPGVFRLHLRGNVSEVADSAKRAVRQGSTIDTPFVMLYHAAIGTHLGMMWCGEGCTGFHRLPEYLDDLVSIFFGPDFVNYLV